VQEQESRAGLEVTASETEARVQAQAEVIGDGFSSSSTITAFANQTNSRFDASVQYTQDGTVNGEAKINLEAGPNGSSAVLAASNVRISGDTTFVGSPITDGALEDDYTQSGTESVTIRGSGEPDSSTKRPFDSDGDGTNDEPLKGDLYIDTSDGNRPYNYDGNNWIQAYTNIQGGDIDTGSLYAQNADVTALLSVGGASSGDRVEIDGDTADPKMIQYSGEDAVVVVTSQRSSGDYSPTQLYNQSFSGSNSHTLSISGESEGELYYDLAVRDTAAQQGKVFVLFKDTDTGNVIGRTEEREFTETEFWTGAFRCPENVSSLEVSVRSSLSSLASGYQFTNQANDPATQLWIHKTITIIDRSGVTVKKGNNRTTTL
jgi:hypothetical protein